MPKPSLLVVSESIVQLANISASELPPEISESINIINHIIPDYLSINHTSTGKEDIMFDISGSMILDFSSGSNTGLIITGSEASSSDSLFHVALQENDSDGNVSNIQQNAIYISGSGGVRIGVGQRDFTDDDNFVISQEVKTRFDDDVTFGPDSQIFIQDGQQAVAFSNEYT